MANMQIKELFTGESITNVLISIIAALALGSLLILVGGEKPQIAYAALLRGAGGDLESLLGTLTRATPLLFSGLAFLIAFKAGLFNIGVEGQIYIGGLLATIAGISFPGLPSIFHVPITLLAAMIGGGIWAAFAGVLKTRYDINEIISTIMLNMVAIFLTSYLISYPLRAPGFAPQTIELPLSAHLYRFFPHSRFNIGFFIAILVSVLIYYLLQRTKLGYEIRLQGANPIAAANGGIDIRRNTVAVMFISGMLGGLAGGVEIMGVHLRFIEGFSPGYGYEGIAVALLGSNNPIAVLASATFFGALKNGGLEMDAVTGVPREMIIVLQAIIIFFVAARGGFRFLSRFSTSGE